MPLLTIMTIIGRKCLNEYCRLVMSYGEVFNQGAVVIVGPGTNPLACCCCWGGRRAVNALLYVTL